MDLTEILFSALIIGAAVAFSDALMRWMMPKVETWVDRDSPWLDRFERPTRS